MNDIDTSRTKTGGYTFLHIFMRDDYNDKVIRLNDQSFDMASYALEAPAEIPAGSCYLHKTVAWGCWTEQTVTNR